LESAETVEREFTPLVAIDDHFPKYVITMDEFFKDTIQGVRHLHINEFLLKKEW
jgi:predicted AAA+ superfamily ATPase